VIVATAGRDGANAEQAQRWNGETGRRWVTHRERHQAEHQNLAPRLLDAATITPGDRVLDVGCGCGGTTIAAARATLGPGRPGGCAVGVDLSRPMLAEARLAEQAEVGNVAFVRADAQACPLRRDSDDHEKGGILLISRADPGFPGGPGSARLRTGASGGCPYVLVKAFRWFRWRVVRRG
jgi:SAM-dependent methyltransferase